MQKGSILLNRLPSFASYNDFKIVRCSRSVFVLRSVIRSGGKHGCVA